MVKEGIEFSPSEPTSLWWTTLAESVSSTRMMSTGLAVPDSTKSRNDLVVGDAGDAVRSLRRYPVALVLRCRYATRWGSPQRDEFVDDV
jgi:hypothetical protein